LGAEHEVARTSHQDFTFGHLGGAAWRPFGSRDNGRVCPRGGNFAAPHALPWSQVRRRAKPPEEPCSGRAPAPRGAGIGITDACLLVLRTERLEIATPACAVRLATTGVRLWKTPCSKAGASVHRHITCSSNVDLAPFGSIKQLAHWQAHRRADVTTPPTAGCGTIHADCNISKWTREALQVPPFCSLGVDDDESGYLRHRTPG
jgi:hypothetical protein